MMRIYCKECFNCSIEGDEDTRLYFWCNREDKEIDFLRDYCNIEEENED